jgi:hypothetical protein
MATSDGLSAKPDRSSQTRGRHRWRRVILLVPVTTNKIMKPLKYLVASTFFCAANSFAAPLPVPTAKAAYIGTWQGSDMELVIAADGKIGYKRDYKEGPGNAKKHIDLSIELKRFNGNSFDAGYGIFQSTFVVSKPPTTDGGTTTMVVDGVELTKSP